MGKSIEKKGPNARGASCFGKRPRKTKNSYGNRRDLGERNFREGFDVITTNTATASMSVTYATQREICAALLHLAEKLERLAKDGRENFLDHPQFEEPRTKFREHCKELQAKTGR